MSALPPPVRPPAQRRSHRGRAGRAPRRRRRRAAPLGRLAPPSAPRTAPRPRFSTADSTAPTPPAPRGRTALRSPRGAAPPPSTRGRGASWGPVVAPLFGASSGRRAAPRGSPRTSGRASLIHLYCSCGEKDVAFVQSHFWGNRALTADNTALAINR